MVPTLIYGDPYGPSFFFFKLVLHCKSTIISSKLTLKMFIMKKKISYDLGKYIIKKNFCSHHFISYRNKAKDYDFVYVNNNLLSVAEDLASLQNLKHVIIARRVKYYKKKLFSFNHDDVIYENYKTQWFFPTLINNSSYNDNGYMDRYVHIGYMIMFVSNGKTI